MRASHADPFVGAIIENDVDRAAGDDGELVLTDLVALREIRIKVVLAGKYRLRRDAGADGEPELHGHAYRSAIQHRQHTRVAEIDEVGLLIRRGTVGDRRP